MTNALMRGLMIRLLDIVFSLCGLLLLLPLLLVLLCVGYADNGSPLFIQTRVGRNMRPFSLIKFRTMRVDTADVPTHLVSSSAVTEYGAFLRRTKLDELPQLINVFIGDMSLVGPRPGLFNQVELTEARQVLNVFAVRPGVTGLAQINGIDMSTPELLATKDSEMIRTLNIRIYLKLIGLTVIGKGQGDRVK